MHMTPARLAQAALQVACVVNSPNMQHWAAVIARDMLCGPGYVRPTSSSLQGVQERQGAPALPHSEDLLLPALTEEIMPHVRAAMDLDHPLADLAVLATPVLRAAVQYVAGFAGNGAAEAIDYDRQQRWSRLMQAKRGLAQEQARLEQIRKEFCEPSTAASAPPAEMALFAALIRAGGWPDIEYTLCQVVGFPCVGNYRDSGLFRSVEEPATIRPGELSNEGHIRDIERALEAEAGRAMNDPERMDILRFITENTRAEASPAPDSGRPAVAFGPFTKAQIDNMFGKGEWRPLLRFYLEQGLRDDGAIRTRLCDNAKTSRTNEMVGVHETISSEDPTFPVLVAYLYAEIFGENRIPLVHATDDIALAYRQLRCAHPEYTVVAIWDTIEGGVRYFTMYGHNFGLKSAVLSFNRHSQLLTWIARRWFGVCCASYFDDVDTCEPSFSGSSGKKVLHDIARLAGTPFAAEKDKDFATANTFLGVLADLSDFVAGSVALKPKPGRVRKIVETLQSALSSDRLSSGLAATICGKCEYTTSSGACGRVGRAPLAALRAWQHRPGRRDDSESLPDFVKEAIKFFIQLLPLLPPRRFFFGRKRRKRRPIIVYTDAMYDKNRTPAGMVGVVIFDPEDNESPWRFSSAAVPESIIAQFEEREQYVGQLEVLAAVAAYTSRDAQLRGRDVIHFIDNVGAYSGLTKGYSRDVDSGRMISVFHTMNAALGANVWFEYVPSKANIADLPSRGDFELLRSNDLKAEWFDLVWPPLSAWSGEYGRLFTLYSEIKGRRKRSRG